MRTRQIPELADLGLDISQVDVTVTRYDTEATVFAQSHHPLDLRPAYGGGYCSYPLRNNPHPDWPWRIEVRNLVPAQPGWLHGIVRLISANCIAIGPERPGVFYARPSELGTFVYVPQQDWDDASYSIGLRIAGS